METLLAHVSNLPNSLRMQVTLIFERIIFKAGPVLCSADAAERRCRLHSVRSAAAQGAEGGPGDCCPRRQRLHEEEWECQSGGVPQGLGPQSQRWVSARVEESLKALGLKVRGEWVPKWRSPSRPWASKSEVSDAAEEWGCGRFWGWLEKCRLPHGLWASIKSINYINNFI